MSICQQMCGEFASGDPTHRASRGIRAKEIGFIVRYLCMIDKICDEGSVRFRGFVQAADLPATKFHEVGRAFVPRPFGMDLKERVMKAFEIVLNPMTRIAQDSLQVIAVQLLVHRFLACCLTVRVHGTKAALARISAPWNEWVRVVSHFILEA